MPCVVYVEKATCLHPGLVIAQDKENGQVRCVCCECRLCGERPHALIHLALVIALDKENGQV